MVQWEDCDLARQPDFSPRPFASPCHVPPIGGVSPGMVDGMSPGVVGGERVFVCVSLPCSF